MKRLSLLLLLPLASGALFAQTTITPATLPNGTVGVAYSQSLSLTPPPRRLGPSRRGRSLPA